jgi:hypothetical protein
VIATQPAALQLRLLQTMVEVAAEKNSTVVLPFPVELLRFLERSTPNGHGDGEAAPPDPTQAIPAQGRPGNGSFTPGSGADTEVKLPLPG